MYITDYQDFADALKNIGTFIDKVYNKKCEHSSPGHVRPKDFEANEGHYSNRIPDRLSRMFTIEDACTQVWAT